MDRLDVHILRELVQGTSYFVADPHFRKSLRFVARRLGVDAGTVRFRIRKLRDSGFFDGWRVYANPRVVGGGEVAVTFDVSDLASKETLVESLLLVDGVRIVAVSLGTWIGVIIRYRDERSLPRQIELVRKLSGVKSATVQRVPFPECPIRLSKSDWAIVMALRGQPRKSPEDISKDVGLATRTVRRRLDRLVNANAIYTFPAVNPKAVQGSVMGMLHVSFLPEHGTAIVEQIVSKYDDYIWHVFRLHPYQASDLQFCHVNLLLPNPSVGHDMEKGVGGFRNVVSARFDILQEGYWALEDLAEALQAAGERTDRAHGTEQTADTLR